MLVFCIFLVGGQHSTAEGINDKETARFGFMQTVMGAVNENDVKVAVRIWTKSLAKELSIPVKPAVSIYPTLSMIKADLEENRVDVLYMTTPQLFALQPLIAEDVFFAVKQSGTITEEYILLVHQDSPANGVRDLKGKRLRVLDNVRTCLSLDWLNFLLSEKGLGGPEAYFQNYTMINKLNEAVLPVFFNQADACLVTRKGFNIMTELNPQIARRMKIIATSPSYIPALLCFRRTYQSQVKQIILRDIQNMVESSSGGQLLTIFQMDGVQQVSQEELTASNSIIKKGLYPFGAVRIRKTKRVGN